jgi:glutamate--cysteine ligase catalytic subunit
MDALLASHYAAILTRDPIALAEADLDSKESFDAFEILHSTVWPHVDFKTPSHDGKAGWRVEFRPLEVQLTDFDNAAFVVFVALLARTILRFDLNLYVPISKVVENMQRAHTRTAITQEKFFFRREIRPAISETNTTIAEEYVLMSIDEIVNGAPKLSLDKSQYFPGLLPMVQSYIDEMYASSKDTERKSLSGYLEFIGKRASGETPTAASWMRHFVQRHEGYRRDSVVSDSVCFDLMRAIRDLSASGTAMKA